MKKTIKSLEQTIRENAEMYDQTTRDLGKRIDQLKIQLNESRDAEARTCREYNEFVLRLADYLGILSKDRWGEQKKVTADEIAVAIMKLKGYVERFEGSKVDVNVENSRLWYMMRVAMHDPSLTPDSVRNGYLENSAVAPDHYTRPSRDTCEERPRDKFPY